MTLPTIHEVTSMFLYGSATPPNNFTENDLTEDRGVKAINVDTDEFLDSDDGPGRFVVASNSVMMQRFFQTAAADYAAGTFSEHRDDATGIVTMTKAQLDEVYGLTANKIWHGIAVDNKWVYDDLDDYAARTYIYGNISFKISEDANFVIYPDGRLEVQNFSLEVLNGNDFDWTTRVDDILTMMGNTVLKRAIDPRGIGQTVLLKFDAATSYTYTQADFSSDVARADSVSTILSPLSISQAMGGVIQELYEEGTIQSVMDGKLVLYGSDNADVISLYTSRTGVNVSDPGYDLPNPLSEHTDDGLIYVAGAGNDTITGTSDEDVLFGGQGADKLFGGSGDDFFFFSAEDTMVNGGAGRDVGWALGQGGVTVTMTAQELEVVIGSSGTDTIILSGSTDLLFAAGGAGNDTFVVTHNDTEGPKILWGGAGADTFEFNQTDPRSYWEQVGIAVVQIAALTEKMFASLTLADLGLEGIDLSKLDAIILNPDAGDTFMMDGARLGTNAINLEEYDLVTGDGGLHLVDDYDTPASLDVRSSGYLGETQAIQSVFFNEVRVENVYTEYFEFKEILVTPDGHVEIKDVDDFAKSWGNLAGATSRAIANSVPWFAEHGSDWVAQEASETPIYFAPFFVVGGHFEGATLEDNGSLLATPGDPGITPFNWLLAA